MDRREDALAEAEAALADDPTHEAGNLLLGNEHVHRQRASVAAAI
jgi:hypothetical protein